MKQKVSKVIPGIILTKPLRCSEVVSIVGFSNKHNTENIIKVILKQSNSLLSFFAHEQPIEESFLNLTNQKSDHSIYELNNTKHFKLLAMQKLKNNEDLSQLILKVSPALRNIFKNLGDRLFIGLRSSRIYDQVQVVRCYNCQEFGHIKPNCTKALQCSKCLENYDSRTCKITDFQCLNCHKSGLDINHSASSSSCPFFKAEYIKLQKNC